MLCLSVELSIGIKLLAVPLRTHFQSCSVPISILWVTVLLIIVGSNPSKGGYIPPTLFVYDLSNIQMPTEVSNYTLSGQATNIVSQDNILYALEYGYIEAIDVSNPQKLTQKWKTAIQYTARSVASNLAISCGSST
jgi:hypothetical protein